MVQVSVLRRKLMELHTVMEPESLYSNVAALNCVKGITK